MDATRIAKLEASDTAGRQALAAGDVAGFLQANHRFHFHIYEAAGSDILSQIVGTLWLRLGPAMRSVSGFFNDENGALPLRDSDNDPHRHAIAALRARDPDALGRAIECDITRGTSLIARGIAAGKV